MRTSLSLALLLVTGMTWEASASAQVTPAPSSSPTPPEPLLPPAAAAAPATVAAPPAAPLPVATTAATTTAPAPPSNWYDKFAVDAFVDAYGSYNSNNPKSQAPVALYPGSTPASVGGAYSAPPGGNSFRALDVAQGFAVNWLGVNAAYSAGTLGATVGLRMGPGAIIYHSGTSDQVAGLQFVKQAYATWKPADKLTLDLGKWDQPFGSEVADSQLNMNYTRSVLWWYMQPLWFTGLRVDYAVSDMLDIKVFAANGWNQTLGVNRSKSFGVQAMVTPVKEAIFYVGYVAGPQQSDFGLVNGAVVDVPSANDHWRHLVDFVADINPTSALRLLLNLDYRTESSLANVGMSPFTHDASVYGGNLVARYAFTDAFSAALRGEYYHDEHGDTLGTVVPGLAATDIENGTLSLIYGLGTHLSFMFDARYDHANNAIFQKNAAGTNDGQFTATLGVIASTK